MCIIEATSSSHVRPELGRAGSIRRNTMRLENIYGGIIIEGEYESVKHMLEENLEADLEYANLKGTNFKEAKYGGRVIKNTIIKLTNLEYSVLIFSGYIKIGCKLHSKEEWLEFTDREILKMDKEKALKFWKIWKETLILICETELMSK